MRYYNATGIKLDFPVFVAIMFLLAICAAVLSMLLVQLIPSKLFDNSVLLSVVAFISVMSLIIAIPISMRNSRVESIDQNLPDVLKHIAVVLRAGSTVESALEEVSISDYGPLADDLRVTLKQLREGKSFDEALMNTALDSGSELFRRVAIIIIDAKKAGAGLANVMEAIADDARELMRIRRERVSRTMMHVIFLYVSSLILSPFIFGFALTVIGFIGSGISCALATKVNTTLFFLDSLLLVFLVIEAVIVSMAVGVIREGRFMKYVLRTPLMILAVLFLYEVGKRVGGSIIGGTTIC